MSPGAQPETRQEARAFPTSFPSPPAEAKPTAPPTSGFDPAGLAIGPGQAFQVLDEPSVVSAKAAHWLEPDDIILGIVWNGEARAYPVSQMAYHHIANDRIGGEPFLVTY